MKLTIIGTGSAGNCYLLSNDKEALVIEAGVRFREVKKALAFNISKIAGVIATHRHLDHAAYLSEFETAGIPVWKPYEDENLRQSIRLGGFGIQSFEAVHNVPCVGYLIEHSDFGRLMYATDTEYVKYRFRDLSAILIEANWDERYVNKDEAKYKHVLTDHLSLQTAIKCIQANKNPKLTDIILCHLSDGNSNEAVFKQDVEDAVGAGITVNVASAGMVVGLGELPF